ncbi:MAG TPA: ABC transporter ATP-binding protein, partial [Myxococcales bacterium]|nr:ABC transporter ATP-binding protein [Myxococcales bacterium]
EPMSGLDPIGRKEVRDLILEQRRAGKTIVFTSHILADVELLCDRVGILRRGEMIHYGKLADLLRAETRRTEVELSQVDESLRAQLEPLAVSIEDEDDRCVGVVEGGDGARPVLEAAIAGGATVLGVTPMRETLEDVFVRDAL